jgi:threonine dehydrogenase-like Zn-dependent dehydrogenase
MRARYASQTASRILSFREQELTPGHGQVLVRVTACGICRGDIRAFLGAGTVERMGHEPVGHVIEVGPGVTRVAQGDWVVGTLHGSFATHVVAHQDEVYRIRPSLGPCACLAEPIKCVTTVVRSAHPSFGDAVAVVGCGFMGLCAVAELAGGHGLADLIAVDPVASRRQLALELGATQAITPQQAVDKSVDVAIEFAGGHDAPNLAARLLKTRGRLALAGGGSLSAAIYSRALTVLHVPPAFSPDESDDYRRAIAAMERGVFPLERLVTHRFRFDQIQEAFEQVVVNPDGYLKGIVLVE